LEDISEMDELRRKNKRGDLRNGWQFVHWGLEDKLPVHNPYSKNFHVKIL
jgi:hypothetical protein